ncbi:MAG: hypothetical protein L0I95_11720 [Tetragenococcus koreensis]|nr:hypothetical protein [Tetragenococcus koreensis]MDN6146891.1 hypothetical protein [Tetragenococcus koreensis]MDN6580453.1 hypothetical protein [Tetragenococcus koreensis]
MSSASVFASDVSLAIPTIGKAAERGSGETKKIINGTTLDFISYDVL